MTGGDSLGFELLQRERERERERFVWVCSLLGFNFGGYITSLFGFFFLAYLHKASKITNKNYFLIVSTPLYV